MMKPLAQAATALPPLAIRADAFVGVTALARYLPSLLQACARWTPVAALSEVVPALSLQAP